MQIKAVYNDDPSRIISNRSKEYVFANVEFLDSNVVGKVMNYNFQITLADLLTPLKDNEIDIYDETLTIAEDFFTYIQYHQDFNYLRNASISKFQDSDGDRIAGITFRVTLQVIRSQNECQIPYKPDDYFPYIIPVIINP